MPGAGGSTECGASFLMGKISVLLDENRDWLHNKVNVLKTTTRTLKNG